MSEQSRHISPSPERHSKRYYSRYRSDSREYEKVQGEHQEIIAQEEEEVFQEIKIQEGEEVFQEMKIQEERDIVDINKSLNLSTIFPYYQERALVTSK
ncbi:unnamed protein product [Rhizopus microsporus]